MPKRTRDYHEFLLEQLTDPVFAASYLNEARQDSQKMFLKALRNVAESRRMAVVAIEAGVNRESLYKSLSEDGNPTLTTYDSILSALGLDYDIKPKQAEIIGSSEPLPATKEPQVKASTGMNYNGGNVIESAYIYTITAEDDSLPAAQGQFDERQDAMPAFMMEQNQKQEAGANA